MMMTLKAAFESRKTALHEALAAGFEVARARLVALGEPEVDANVCFASVRLAEVNGFAEAWEAEEVGTWNGFHCCTCPCGKTCVVAEAEEVEEGHLASRRPADVCGEAVHAHARVCRTHGPCGYQSAEAEAEAVVVAKNRQPLRMVLQNASAMTSR